MKPRFSLWCLRACAVLLLFYAFQAAVGSLQLVTQRNSGLSAPAGGDGDSATPILNANGRYVLFASSADNLVLNNGSNAITGPFPPKLNVFLRDRTNLTTSLVSVNLSGTGGGNGDSIPVEISTDGRYALFES